MGPRRICYGSAMGMVKVCSGPAAVIIRVWYGHAINARWVCQRRAMRLRCAWHDDATAMPWVNVPCVCHGICYGYAVGYGVGLLRERRGNDMGMV